MAEENAKSYLIGMTFGTQGFSELLITYPSLEFRDSKWRIQFGRQNCESYLIGMIFGTRGFLESLIMNPISKFINRNGGSNMAY